VGIQRITLEHHRHVALAGSDIGDVTPADADPPSRSRLQSRDHPEQGRLSAARRTHHREHLTVAHVHAETRQRDRAIPVDGGDLL
jgi:hypothetical protein